MLNPILQMLSGSQQNQNNLVQRIASIKSMIGGNPQSAYNVLMQNNPQFRQFVNDNGNKSIEDIALEYDLDLDLLKSLLK